MPDIYSIIVAFLDDTRKAPETRAHIKENDKFWSDGCQILSKDESAINALADLFDQLGAQEVCTGYYDPAEDERQGETDEYTGYFYLEAC